MEIEQLQNYELTKEHFEKFKKYFQFWINEFGLKDWEIAYFFEKTEDRDGIDARASVHFDHEGRIVVCCLNKEWYGSDPTDHNLSRCSYHEVVELLLGKLNGFARIKFSETEVSQEIHRVIRILENTHFEYFWNE